jgi:transcriptional regulator with XRE-family HTH domain
VSLGKTLRLRRIERDITAKALAETVGVSPSMISKIEHDVVSPSLDTIRSIASALHVSVSEFVDPTRHHRPATVDTHPSGRIDVVRREDRKLLNLPRSGLLYQILTPDLQGNIEFVWLESEPGVGGKQFFSHAAGEECMLVLEGELHVYFEDRTVVLEKGDCLSFDARLPHRYANEGTEKAVMVYIAVPPTL